MKISDIIAESTEEKDRDKAEFKKFTRRAAGEEKKLITPIWNYMSQGYSYTAAHAKAIGDYYGDQIKKTASTRDKPRDKKPADKPTKPEKTSRASRFATVGADATKQATGAISKAWQRGERWSRALGIPKPKKKKD